VGENKITDELRRSLTMNKHNHKNVKHIKEYIYLDNIEVNSILAQFEDGIPKVIEEIKQSTETNAVETAHKMSNGVSGGVNLGAKGEFNFNGEYEANNSDTNSEMYQEAISTVYHDYAVNIMTKELDDANLLKTTTKQPEGAFVQLTSSFNIIDPMIISSNIGDEMVSFLSSFDTNNDDLSNAKEGFNLITNFGKLLNNLFPNSILLSTNNALTIAEKDNFRMNESQLKSLVLANRKITILGKIESIISENDLNSNLISEGLLNNPVALTTLMPKFSFFLLSSFGLIKKDDRLVKPIAIYFE
jgi:hypothetical protein